MLQMVTGRGAAVDMLFWDPEGQCLTFILSYSYVLIILIFDLYFLIMN